MLVLAWSLVPSADEDGGAKTTKAKPAHADPWAKDAPAQGVGATSP
ncbi:hypothetical protein [Novosphingobium taihuense]|nr:hypothetical protein [Novosphingobium taihuense]